MDSKFSEQEDRIVVIRYFAFESEARLYAARLKEAELPCFISNANMNSTLPLSSAGIGLHVKLKDKDQALAILKEVDTLKREFKESETFHEADHEDIDYYRALHQPSPSNQQWLMIAIGTLVILLILRALFRALGWVDSWRDMF